MSNGVFESYETNENSIIINTHKGTWEHLGGSQYEISYLFTFVIDIEFISQNEMRIKYIDLFEDEEQNYEEWGYHKRIQ